MFSFDKFNSKNIKELESKRKFIGNDIIETSKQKMLIEEKNRKNIEKLELAIKNVKRSVNMLNQLELSILIDFRVFSEVVGKIQNKPEFINYSRCGVKFPKYDEKELKETLNTATRLSKCLHDAKLYTSETKILDFSAIGILGNLLLRFTNNKLSKKIQEESIQINEIEKKINEVCNILGNIENIVNNYIILLKKIRVEYQKKFTILKLLINRSRKTSWNDFRDDEKLIFENTILLVGILYNMCKLQLEIDLNENNEISFLNEEEVKKVMIESEKRFEII